MTDLRYSPNGTITPISEIADPNSASNVDDALAKAGWTRFLTIGSEEVLEILVWRRLRNEDITQYALQVGGPVDFSEFVVVEGLPAMMALAAQWAPALTAGEVSLVRRKPE